MKTNEIIIRRMTEDDIDGVVEVENSSFTIPWSKKAFLDEMGNSLAIYFIALDRDRVVGYCGMWDVSGEGDITNIAVLPEYRGIGIGRKLISSMILEAKRRELYSVTLEVRQSNTVAKNMYKSCGFVSVGTRKKYYADNGEDAIIMTVELS